MEPEVAAIQEQLLEPDGRRIMLPTIDQLATDGLARWGSRMGRSMFLEGLETAATRRRLEYCDARLVGVTLQDDGTFLHAMVSLPAGAVLAMTSTERAEAVHTCSLMTYCADAPVVEVPVSYLVLFAAEVSRLVEARPRDALVYFYDQDDGTAVPSLVELGSNAPYLPDYDLEVRLCLGATVEIYFQGLIVCEDWSAAGEGMRGASESVPRAAEPGTQRPVAPPIAASPTLVPVENVSGPMSTVSPTPSLLGGPGAGLQTSPGLGTGPQTLTRVPGPFRVPPSPATGARGRGREHTMTTQGGSMAPRRQASIPPPSMERRLQVGNTAVAQTWLPQPWPASTSDLATISQQLQNLMAVQEQDRLQLHLLRARLDRTDQQVALLGPSIGQTVAPFGQGTLAPTTHPGAADSRAIVSTPLMGLVGDIDALARARRALGLSTGALPPWLAALWATHHGQTRLDDTQSDNAIFQEGEYAEPAIQLGNERWWNDGGGKGDQWQNPSQWPDPNSKGGKDLKDEGEKNKEAKASADAATGSGDAEP